MTAYYWLHLFILIFSVAGVICWAIVARHYRSPALLVATSLYLANVIAFSAARLLKIPMDVSVLNSWSQGIRLQAVITLAGAGIAMMLYWHKRDE
jgi:hypothetical protein